jgi:hypothetical protein
VIDVSSSCRARAGRRTFCLIGDDGAVRGRHQVEAAGQRQREEVVRGGGGVRQGGEDGQHAGGDTQPAGAEAHRQEPRRRRLHHRAARGRNKRFFLAF